MNNLEKRMSEISNQEKIAVDAILKRNSEILKFVEELFMTAFTNGYEVKLTHHDMDQYETTGTEIMIDSGNIKYYLIQDGGYAMSTHFSIINSDGKIILETEDIVAEPWISLYEILKRLSDKSDEFFTWISLKLGSIERLRYDSDSNLEDPNGGN